MDEYNEMTPRELNLRAEIYSNQKKMDREDKLTIAYLTAYWQRVESLEPLEQILSKLNKDEKQQMTDFEMFVKVQQLNSALGGSVK